MGAFNLAVVIPDNETVDHEQFVANAMDPYRGTEWYWYSFERLQWPKIYAHIDSLGRWVVGMPPEGLPVVVVCCKW